MAYAGGKVFVPVVDYCMKGDTYGYPRFISLDYTRGTGELVALDAATGARVCATRSRRRTSGVPRRRRTSSSRPRTAAASTASQRVTGVLWKARSPAGVNACPTVDGDTLFVAAGADPHGVVGGTHELTAYALP